MANPNIADDFDDEDVIDVHVDEENGAPHMPGGDIDAEDMPDDAEDKPRAGANDDDDDDADLSAKVRKRIAKERRKRGDAERAASAARAEAEELKRQLQEARGHMTNVAAENLDRQYASLKAELKQAIEDGDTDKQLELEDKLFDLRVDLKAVKTRRPVEDERPQQQRQPAPQSQEDRREAIYSTMHPKARVWAKSIKLLDRDPELVGIAVSVEAAVAKSGLDPNSDDYYAELDKRLRTRAPELYDAGDDDADDLDEDEAPARQPQAKPRINSPVAAPTRQAAPSGARAPGSRVRLSAEQVSNMRQFGLDPTNPAHVAEYAKNTSR